jgi:hypothetical protein
MPTDLGPGPVLASAANAVAAFLATLLILSAAHKLLGRERATASASDLLGVQGGVGRLAMWSAVASELAAGFALIPPPTRLFGALLAAGLWFAYLCAIQRAIRGGRRDLDCGCSLSRTHAPLGTFELARNLILVALAAGVALMTASTAPEKIPASDALSAMALAAIYLAVDQTAALRRELV